MRHLSGAEPAGRGLPRERRRGRREPKAVETRPPTGRGSRGEAALGAARPPPSGRAALQAEHRGLPRLTQSHRPRLRGIRPPGRGHPAPPPGHSEKAHRLPGPPRNHRSRFGRAGGGRGEDHVNGLRSLSAAQVSGRGCAAGLRGCCGDAGRRRPRAAPPPPRGPALQSLGHRRLPGAPLGCRGVGPARSLPVVALEDTSAGCGPEVAQAWGAHFLAGAGCE